MITTHSMQTEGAPGLNKIPKNSIISETDYFSAPDMRGLFGAKESASISDAGWTSDCSFSSTELVAQEGESFKLLAKGQSSKPKTLEITKSKTNLSNRFECLKDYIPTNDDTWSMTSRQMMTQVNGRKSSPPSPRIVSRGNRPNYYKNNLGFRVRFCLSQMR